MANRLPVKITRDETGELHYSISPGGMVSALLGVRGMRMVWVGWAEIADTTPQEREMIRRTLWRRGCVPVFLTKEEAKLYYNGFCNDVLWPLFHYVVSRMPDTRGDLKSGLHAQWEAYQTVNGHFSSAILRVARCAGNLCPIHCNSDPACGLSEYRPIQHKCCCDAAEPVDSSALKPLEQ